jgi:acetyl esterase/lipase
VYLRHWAIHSKGIPIISLDYSLTPKDRYPVQLEELLDVYLYLTSGLSEVKDLIGFIPDKIIMVGDSAGGLMILSMTMILNDLKDR